ncbi:hypothetical protein [Alkalicoccus daliensis]|uniref:Uncharacterized protein n=1 Tax=Alkalicoccus daliensis TaxID=745820 RepID=A0A1H0H2G3_9BACI|nr:hypothetical protein [Alkalicoccus daliensis]SDO13328.1 hypothetical protein SAMN04488053_107151 [Alkalicoccus daliensis]
MNNDCNLLTIYLRRAFDWHGGKGIEMFAENPEVFIFADTFHQAQAELLPLINENAEVIFQIEPSMSRDEFTQLNEALLEWHAEAE